MRRGLGSLLPHNISTGREIVVKVRMTALAEALDKAGYQSPEQRLRDIAVEAWTKWSRKEAGEARRQFVANKLRHELTWTLIELWQPQALIMAVGRLLNSVEKEIAAQRPQEIGGHQCNESHGGYASSDDRSHAHDDPQESTSPAVPLNQGPLRCDAQPRSALGGELANIPAPSTKDSYAEATESRISYASRLSKLDQFNVNGQKLRYARVSEIRESANSLGVRSIFYKHLTANMADHWILGDYVNDEMAEQMYERAEAEYASAA